MSKDSISDKSFDKFESTRIRPDLLHALIDNAEHSISIAEREGEDTILLYVNQAFEKMTGYTAEESLYKDCRFLQRDDRQKQVNRKIRKAIEDNEPVRVVLRNYRKDGTLFWNELTITPYYDSVDQITYYIGVQKNLGSKLNNEYALDVINLKK